MTGAIRRRFHDPGLTAPARGAGRCAHPGRLRHAAGDHARHGAGRSARACSSRPPAAASLSPEQTRRSLERLFSAGENPDSLLDRHLALEQAVCRTRR